MAWYDKYLSIYGKPFKEVPQVIIDGTRERLASLQSDKPLASIVVIGYNEETHLQACLWAISEIKCKYPVEIIGVDNDSMDRTAEIYKRLIVLADDDNYMELLKLIDFASIYYDSNIEYFEYLRDCLEMNLKGYSMCNSRYSDTREEFGKFVDKKISEYEDVKVYKLKKVTS